MGTRYALVRNSEEEAKKKAQTMRDDLKAAEVIIVGRQENPKFSRREAETGERDPSVE